MSKSAAEGKREFDEKEELEAIERRYQYARDNLRLTIPRLRGNRIFMQTYDRLTEEGWKDWHVLLAVAGIAKNYKQKVLGRDRLDTQDFAGFTKRYVDEFFSAESEDDPRPPVEEFTDEKMEFSLDMAILAMLEGKGWEQKNPTPHLRALRRFAAERYRFFELDVDHEPFFRERS